MTNATVAIVDYGLGNLLSVRRGLEFCGANTSVTADPAEILAASHVVLPGVGAFRTGMHALQRQGFVDVLREVVHAGKPLLGICLGMQLLFDESDEFESTPGLGILPGRVTAIPTTTTDGAIQKVPHIGWSGIVPGRDSAPWAETFLSDVEPGSATYFVHSFAAKPAHGEDVVAECDYGGWRICAAVARDNVMGTQFHPEKSGPVGLRALASFLRQ
jgi:glutamine amidotransferase